MNPKSQFVWGGDKKHRDHTSHHVGDSMSDIQAIKAQVVRESDFVSELTTEISRRIIGQDYMVERILIGMICGGHVLLEGVPGLAKTLTVKTLAEAISLDFSRIQFTPDLLPADVIGTLIYNQKSHDFAVRKGPGWTNIVLAAEIHWA